MLLASLSSTLSTVPAHSRQSIKQYKILLIAFMIACDRKDLVCFQGLVFSPHYEMLSALRSRRGLTHLSRYLHGVWNSAEHLMGSQHIFAELNSLLRRPIHSHLSLMRRTNGDQCQVPMVF